MTCANDLFAEQPEPFSEVLIDWLKGTGVLVSDGVEVRASLAGGWGVFATRDLEPDELSTSTYLSLMHMRPEKKGGGLIM